MKAELTLPVAMANQVEQVLVELRRMTEAECVLLADISGQLICLEGQIESSDPVLVAALAASDVAAMAELSRQIGEENPSGAFLHEGQERSIYLCNIAGTLILSVIFRNETPVGLVRLFAGRASDKLRAVSDKFEEHIGPGGESPSADFGTALSDELEKTFGNL